MLQARLKVSLSICTAIYTAICTLLLLSAPVIANTELTITVFDKNKQALNNIVVELQSPAFEGLQAEKSTAVMQQLDQQFVPHVLAVSKNSVVEFPDSDTVKHHVYSFSPTKTFEIAIYNEAISREVELASSGIVELGCNIHDWMLGYIYVAQSPIFSQTNVSGQASFIEPVAGIFIEPESRAAIRVKIWHPRLAQADIDMTYALPSSGDLHITLSEDLIPSYADFDDVHGVSDYE